jgi:uncharacterized protein
MELSNSCSITAPQEQVWAALNDPAMLTSCIAGCESLEPISPTEYQVVLAAKIGPIKARFKGKLTVSDIVAPASYTLTFEGQGGAAGFAKGLVDVALSPEGDGTLLTYSAKAQIGGKLAQIGSRLVDSAANKMADEFFAAFNYKLSSPDSDDEAQLEAQADDNK